MAFDLLSKPSALLYYCPLSFILKARKELENENEVIRKRSHVSEVVTLLKMEMETLDDDLFSVFDNQSANSSKREGENEQEKIWKRSVMPKGAKQEHTSDELEISSRKRQKLDDPDLE